MGCGKSFWGARMAEYLQLTFVDLDDSITQRLGLSIPEIFSQKGEETFRQTERECLRDTISRGPAVIAVGGGAPCFFDNMEWMNAQGTTIYLKTPIEVLINRLRINPESRPLLFGMGEVEMQAYAEDLLAQREIFYLEAQYVIEYNADSDTFFQNLLALTDLEG